MADRLEHIIGIIASLLLLALMLLTTFDVIGRNILNHPLPGGLELTELLLVIVAFLLFPQVALREKHIVADLLDSVRGRRARAVLRAIQYMLGGSCGAILFALIGWRTWILADRTAGYGDATSSLQIPLAPVFYFASILAFITAVAFAVTIGRAFTPPPDFAGTEVERTPSLSYPEETGL